MARIDPHAEETSRQKAGALRDVAGSRLEGRIAVVTGADSGIGAAVAIAFAREGADVAVPIHEDRNGAMETRQQVEDAGRRATTFDLDQRDPGSVRRFFAHVRDELGAPDVLVNNAAVNLLGKRVVDMTNEDMEEILRTDFLGPFYCTKEFLAGLDLQEGGRPAAIVNVTSVHEDVPMPGAAGYDAAKGALRNFTRTLALELAATNVRVNNLAPGMVLTPFNERARQDPRRLEEASEGIPMKRPAQPSEIARAALFLASEDASYVTGETLFVDGGLRFAAG